MKHTYDGEDGPVQVLALLLFVQGALAVAFAAEAVGAAIVFSGVPAFGAILTVAGATTTLVLVARLPRRRRSTRRWIVALQMGWIALAIIDLLLALALAGRGLTPSGFLVRIVLPVSIVWLLRRPDVREWFSCRDEGAGTEPSRLLEEVST